MFQPDLLAVKRVLITGGGTGSAGAWGTGSWSSAPRSRSAAGAEVLEETAREHAAATGGEVTTQVCDVREADAVERLFAKHPLAALVNNAAGNFLARSEELSPRAVDAGSASCSRAAATARSPAAGAGSPGATPARCSASPRHAPGPARPTCCRRRPPRRACWRLRRAWRYAGTRSRPGRSPRQARGRAWRPGRTSPIIWRRATRSADRGEHRGLADLAAFLLADGSAFINGEVVTIDGGEWLKGAGQFSFLQDRLSEEDWQALRPKKAG